jgi:hypothetical protein
LHNNTDWRVTEVKGREFTSNEPVNIETPTTAFTAHNAFIVRTSVEIRLRQRYITRPDRRYYYSSRLPVFTLSYSKGIPAAGAVVDFDKVSAGITYDYDFNMLGESGIRIVAGTFLNNRRMEFMDFHHFNGNRTLVAFSDYRGFQLLDYYTFSTKESFFEGHYNHHFNGFILNKVPLLRKLRWQEVFSLNYLRTPHSGNYLEMGAGLEHIFKLIRADFFVAYQGAKQQRYGVVIGFGF